MFDGLCTWCDVLHGGVRNAKGGGGVGKSGVVSPTNGAKIKTPVEHKTEHKTEPKTKPKMKPKTEPKWSIKWSQNQSTSVGV